MKIASYMIICVMMMSVSAFAAYDKSAVTYDLTFGSGQYQGTNHLEWDPVYSEYKSDRFNDGFSSLLLNPNYDGNNMILVRMSTSDGDGMASWHGVSDPLDGSIVSMNYTPASISDMANPNFTSVTAAVPEPTGIALGASLFFFTLLKRPAKLRYGSCHQS